MDEKRLKNIANEIFELLKTKELTIRDALEIINLVSGMVIDAVREQKKAIDNTILK